MGQRLGPLAGQSPRGLWGQRTDRDQDAQEDGRRYRGRASAAEVAGQVSPANAETPVKSRVAEAVAQRHLTAVGRMMGGGRTPGTGLWERNEVLDRGHSSPKVNGDRSAVWRAARRRFASR